MTITLSPGFYWIVERIPSSGIGGDARPFTSSSIEEKPMGAEREVPRPAAAVDAEEVLLPRATMGGDSEVVRALLNKGANPNINDMGMTPFLVAAGVGPGNRGGTGLAAQYSAGGPVNMELMELLLQHGADVNAQITGTRTYSMRVSRAPSANEGFTALHLAAETGNTDLVRYLLGKGARADITDADGHKAIDLVSADGPAEIRSLLTARSSR